MSKKVLLVAMNAKYIHSNLGIYCLRSYGIKHGIPKECIEIAEYTINQNLGDILGEVYRKKPDILAFSVYIWNRDMVFSLAEELHKIMPQVPIFFGGPEVSFDSEKVMDEAKYLAGIMRGEGEQTFLETYQVLQGQKDYKDVLGLTWRDGNHNIIINQDRPNMSMDEVVFPYGDLSDLEHRIIYYETSRGCPFGCSYCLSSVDRNVRIRSMELVQKELQFFLDHNVPQVKFVDRTFNCRPDHTMAIWKYIHEHDNGITNFHFEMSAELLSQEEIDYVATFRPGLVQFEIGVQSTNQDTLRAIRRGSKLEVLQEKVQKVRGRRNIHQHLDLIAGLPYEDYQSFRQSFHDVYAMQPDQLQLGFLKVLKGSPMEEKREEYGLAYTSKPPYEVLYTKWLSYEDVLRLKLVEDMVERYYNSMQFEASIPYVVSLYEEAFDFYQEIGMFYQECGYLGLHQSRLQNYQILLEFVEQSGKKYNAKLLKELMVFDLYQRENLKSRPKFLVEEPTATQRDFNRRFYENQKMRQRFLQGYQEMEPRQIARMTHLEHFQYDILNYLRQGIISEKHSIVLFDYQKRNPLDHQCKTWGIPAGQEEM